MSLGIIIQLWNHHQHQGCKHIHHFSKLVKWERTELREGWGGGGRGGPGGAGEGVGGEEEEENHLSRRHKEFLLEKKNSTRDKCLTPYFKRNPETKKRVALSVARVQFKSVFSNSLKHLHAHGLFLKSLRLICPLAAAFSFLDCVAIKAAKKASEISLSDIVVVPPWSSKEMWRTLGADLWEAFSDTECGVTRPHARPVLNSTVNCQAAFRRSCIILLNKEQCVKGSIFLHPPQHWNCRAVKWPVFLVHGVFFFSLWFWSVFPWWSIMLSVFFFHEWAVIGDH